MITEAIDASRASLSDHPRRISSSKKQLTEHQALERWAMVAHLQHSLDDVASRHAATVSAHLRGLRVVEHSFESAFGCPAAMLGFLAETRHLNWSGRKTPWEFASSLAYELETAGTLVDTAHISLSPATAKSPSAMHLRAYAQTLWCLSPEERPVGERPDRPGFGFVLQEAADDGFWTSIPMWADDLQQIKQQVLAGWINGRSRWAASIGVDGEEPQFITGLNRQGKPLDRSDVQPVIRASVESFELPTKHIEAAQAEQRQRA